MPAAIRPLPEHAVHDAGAIDADRRRRWNRASVHLFEGTYGEYLIAKVAQVFPELGQRVLKRRRSDPTRHPGQERVAIVGQAIAAPGNVLIGPDERQIGFVKIAAVVQRHVEEREGYAARLRRARERLDIGIAAEAQERKAEGEMIEERIAAAEEEMRRAAAGTGARRVDGRIVLRRRRAVRHDDARAFVTCA
jgi:hypothetical protein